MLNSIIGAFLLRKKELHEQIKFFLVIIENILTSFYKKYDILF